jgi:hypothetical protein
MPSIFAFPSLPHASCQPGRIFREALTLAEQSEKRKKNLYGRAGFLAHIMQVFLSGKSFPSCFPDAAALAGASFHEERRINYANR